MSEGLSSKEIADNLHQNIQRTLDQMISIWAVSGITDENQVKYLKFVQNHISELLKDMLQEAKDRQHEIVSNIDATHKKLNHLHTQLKLDIPDYEFDDLPLQAILNELQDKMKELEVIKEKRCKSAAKLCEKEQKLCEALGEKPIGILSDVPSEDELKELETHIKQKEVQVIKMKQTFKEMRKAILKMMNEISYIPSNDFEYTVVENYDNFIFSSSNMCKLQNLKDHIKSTVDYMREQALNKRAEIVSLCSLLEIPKEDYEQFLSENSDCDIETIKILDKEIEKYRKLRMANISKFIIKLREEIEHWWDICKFGQEQRESFQPYYSDNYDEDNLSIHENELKELKQFYEENRKLIDLFTKREDMWEEKKELDRRSEDPDRFHNRGGQLLTEEKLRKKIDKDLPKIEAQLSELFDEFEAKNGRPFTIFGRTLEEYKVDQSEKQQAEMENLKQLKVKAKEEKKSGKKTPLSASRRNLTPGMSMRSAQTSLKRKINRSPGPSTTKSMRLASSENSKSTYSTSSKVRRRSRRSIVSRNILKSSDNTTNVKIRSIGNRSKRRSQRLKKKMNDSMNDTIQKYESFQEHLSAKKELRSTMLSDSISSPNKSKKKIVKTPVKPLRKHVSPSTPYASLKIFATPGSSKSPRMTKTPKTSKFSVINLDSQDQF